MKTVVVIPARIGSTRFPGKVLAKLGGKPIIQWVWERASRSKADAVLVATDDETVLDTVRSFGGKAVMTRKDHPTGSDRIWEAAKDLDADLIVNLQGDEPLTPPQVVNDLIDAMEKSGAEMGTVVVPVTRDEVKDNPNQPKVILSADGFAMYFSRSMIPYLREGGRETQVYRHWGIYAYRKEALGRFVSLPQGELEQCEKLEQLRALENGMRIKVIQTTFRAIGIDTPEDLVNAEKLIAERGEK